MDFGSAETERLRLEAWSDRHAEALAAMNADADVMRFIDPGRPLSRAASDASSERIRLHWDTYGFGLWAVFEKVGERFVGLAGVCHPLWFPAFADGVEVGWRLRRDAWGHGYATEAARAALQAGFERLDLAEILAFVHPDNERSLAVARRLGMTHRGDVAHPERPPPITIFIARRHGGVAPRSRGHERRSRGNA